MKKQVWNSRVKRILAAVKAAKERDGWRCQACGAVKADGALIDGAHILPRSVDPAQADNSFAIVSLCRDCHHDYDRSDKIYWLKHYGLFERFRFVFEKSTAKEKLKLEGKV